MPVRLTLDGEVLLYCHPGDHMHVMLCSRDQVLSGQGNMLMMLDQRMLHQATSNHLTAFCLVPSRLPVSSNLQDVKLRSFAILG